MAHVSEGNADIHDIFQGNKDISFGWPSTPDYSPEDIQRTNRLEALNYLRDLITKLNSQLVIQAAAIKKGELTPQKSFSQSFASTLYHLEQSLYLYTQTANISKNNLYDLLAENPYYPEERVDIQIKENAVLIRMPLLPKKSSKQDLLYNALSAKLFQTKDLPRWPYCHISFCHVYPANVPTMPRDSDNYAYKRAIDLAVFAIVGSDCPKAVDLSMRTVFTDDLPVGTYMEITPKSSDFQILPSWEK